MLKDQLAQIFEVNHGQHKALSSMEGLRGFAVLLVFFVHYANDMLQWTRFSDIGPLVGFLREFGNCGVDLFFVLSGYLIYGSLMKRPQSFASYWRRRVQRIYPAFIVVYVIYIALSFVFPEKSRIPTGDMRAIVYLIENFLLLPGIFPIAPMNTVAWSLSFEILFYVAIPALIWLLRLRAWQSQARIALFVVLSALIYFLVPKYIPGFWHNVRMMMFLGGMILYDTRGDNYGRTANIVGIAALITGLVVYGYLIVIKGDYQWRTLTLFLTLPVLCFACFRSAGFCNQIFSWTPLRWLGNMSYSYYLIHALTVHTITLALSLAIPPTANEGYLFWLMLLPVFLATLVVSAVLFIYVEKPYSLAVKPKPAATS
jgi:exopolysaccharide production protein ExoZ